MKLGIDGYFLCGKRTGMEVMLLNILAHWNGSRFEKTVLFLPENNDEVSAAVSGGENIEICVIRRRSFPVWEQMVIPRYAHKLGLECLWFPYNTASLLWNKRLVVTIHDMIFMHGSFLKQPTAYKKFGQLYRKWLVPLVAKKADRILTSSQTSAREITSFCPCASEKISVVYCSCKLEGGQLSQQAWENWCRDQRLPSAYIMAVGSIDERKNTLRTVEAFEKLCEEEPNLHLVLYGFKENRTSKVYEYIQASRWADRIHALGYISEEEKNSLYAHAKVFSFASLSEGFGIPILEAFYHETVVVTSNVTSMPEIAGEAAVYVDPESVESIYEGLKTALRADIRETLIPKGKERLKVFTWDNVTNAAMQAILS